MKSNLKIFGSHWQEALRVINCWRVEDAKVGFVNGCFDLLHIGHVRFLEDASCQCDKLIVGLNADSSTSSLKGSQRPLFPLHYRMEMMAALECVSMVLSFDDVRVTKLLPFISPNFWFKGAGYPQALDEEEKWVAEAQGIRLQIIPARSKLSTTCIIQLISDGSAISDY